MVFSPGLCVPSIACCIQTHRREWNHNSEKCFIREIAPIRRRFAISRRCRCRHVACCSPERALPAETERRFTRRRRPQKHNSQRLEPVASASSATEQVYDAAAAAVPPASRAGFVCNRIERKCSNYVSSFAALYRIGLLLLQHAI